MKLITRNTDYAIRALCSIMSQKRKIVPVSELVSQLKIPRPFLRKILQRLNRKKILTSHKGSGGGFSLRKNPEKIFLMEIIEIFQGPLHLNECFLKKLKCPNVKMCCLKKKIDKIEVFLLKQLESITIASLLKGGN